MSQLDDDEGRKISIPSLEGSRILLCKKVFLARSHLRSIKADSTVSDPVYPRRSKISTATTTKRQSLSELSESQGDYFTGQVMAMLEKDNKILTGNDQDAFGISFYNTVFAMLPVFTLWASRLLFESLHFDNPRPDVHEGDQLSLTDFAVNGSDIISREATQPIPSTPTVPISPLLTFPFSAFSAGSSTPQSCDVGYDFSSEWGRSVSL